MSIKIQCIYNGNVILQWHYVLIRVDWNLTVSVYRIHKTILTTRKCSKIMHEIHLCANQLCFNVNIPSWCFCLTVCCFVKLLRNHIKAIRDFFTLKFCNANKIRYVFNFNEEKCQTAIKGKIITKLRHQ